MPRAPTVSGPTCVTGHLTGCRRCTPEAPKPGPALSQPNEAVCRQLSSTPLFTILSLEKISLFVSKMRRAGTVFHIPLPSFLTRPCVTRNDHRGCGQGFRKMPPTGTSHGSLKTDLGRLVAKGGPRSPPATLPRCSRTCASGRRGHAGASPPGQCARCCPGPGVKS